MVRSIDTLPLEVLDIIFWMVCTDGGPMGAVLSGVSKFVRAASARARFHTTIVNGEVQVKRLAEELARPDRAYDFNVRHLLIFAKRTSTVHVCDDYGTVPRPANSIDGGRPFSSLELSIQQILRSAAPTVRNLMVFAPMLDFVRLQQDVAFAQLSDLTLHSHSLNHPPVPGRPEAAEGIASTLVLSTVHRLHLCQVGFESGRHSGNYVAVFQTVHASFPSIEYLRLSGLGPSESNLLAALRVYFRIPKEAIKTDVGLTATLKRWLIGSASDGLLNAEVKALCGIMKTLKRLYLQRTRRNDEGSEPQDALRWLLRRDGVKGSGKALLLPKEVVVHLGFFAAEMWYDCALGFETCYMDREKALYEWARQVHKGELKPVKANGEVDGVPVIIKGRVSSWRYKEIRCLGS